MPLSDSDADLMARTAVAEGGGDPASQVAVMSAIRNRLATGKYGSSISGIVQAPKQFETWSNGSIAKVDPSSPQYQQALRLANAVADGLPDNTGGATHFYSPGAQAAMGRNTPAWAKGQTTAVGGNTYFAPQGKVTYAGATPQAPVGTPEAPPVAKGDDLDNLFASVPTVGTATPASNGGDLDSLFASIPSAGPSQPAAPQVAAEARPLTIRVPTRQQPAQSAPNASAPGLAGVAVPAPATSAIPAPDQGAQGAFQGNMLSGLPILGPLIGKGEDYVGSRIGAAISGLSPQQVSQNAANIQQQTNQLHPVASTAGGIAGTIAGYGILGASATGARALGAVGDTLEGRALLGGATNALIGGTDAGIRSGGDENAIVTGAGTGAAGGILGPYIGRIAGDAAGALWARLSPSAQATIKGLPKAATNALLQTLNIEGPDVLAARLNQLGPHATVVDASPAFQGQGQGLVTDSIPARVQASNVLNARAIGKNARINADVDAALGPAESDKAAALQMKADRSEVHSDLPEHFANASPVDVSDIYDTINRQIASGKMRGPQLAAAQRIRDMLVGTPAKEAVPTIAAERVPVTNAQGQVIRYDMKPAVPGTLAIPAKPTTDAQTLNNVKIAARSLIKNGDPALGIQRGDLAQSDGLAKNVLGQINDKLRASSEEYANIMDESSNIAKQVDALKLGREQVLSKGQTAIRPDDFAKQWATMSVDEKAAVKLGVRAHIDHALGNTENDFTAIKKEIMGDDDWNNQKLKIIFGDKPVDDLAKTIDREGTFSETQSEFLKKSNTARLKSGQDTIPKNEPKPPIDASKIKFDINDLGSYGPRAAVKYGLNPFLNTFRNPVDMEPVHGAMAKMLFSQGAERDAYLAEMQNALTRRQVGTVNAGKSGKGLAKGANLLTDSGGKLAEPYVRDLTIRRSQGR